MRLKVDLVHWSGIVVDDDPGPPEAEYELIDADTGASLCPPGQLKTYEEVEAHIATHHPGCERWAPPAASAKDAAALARMLELLDAGTALDRVVIRRFLIGQLYQCGYSEKTVAKIKAALARL